MHLYLYKMYGYKIGLNTDTKIFFVQIQKWYIPKVKMILNHIEGRHDTLLQYSCLENPVDRGAW